MEHRLIDLDPEHPGFRDSRYRARRDAIAHIALAYRSGDPVPLAPYSEEEHAVWRGIRQALAPVHREGIATPLLELERALDLDGARIPQLRDVNARLGEATDFSMEPVAGLVTPRTFMEHLGRGVFLSTQYIRHHSRPFYTPEPDVVHELVGHAASLLHPGVCALSQAFGRAAAIADERAMERLTRIYWYTLEFGVLMEEGQVKGYGAGLLSSVGELQRARSGEVPLLEWDLDAVCALPYDPTTFQPYYLLAPSFEQAISDVGDWIAAQS